MNIKTSRNEAEYSYNKYCNEQSIKRRQREFEEKHITITRKEYERLLAVEQELRESKMTPEELAYSRLKNPCEMEYISHRRIRECDKKLEDNRCCGCSKNPCHKCEDTTCEYNDN